MLKIRFKSLTMQIWSYFFAMILFIVLIFFLINFLMVKRNYEERIFRTLHVYQDIIMDIIVNNLNNKYQNDYIGARLEDRLSNDKKPREIGYFLVKNNRLYMIGPRVNRFYVRKHFDLMTWMKSYIPKIKNGNGRFLNTYQKLTVFFLIKKLTTANDSFYIITYSHKPENRETEELIWITLAITLLSLLVAKLISNNLSKPLKSLERYTEQIARKEWSAPLELDREDEIGRLANSMNQMQKSLKNADEEERAFLQSISHDLKTPVMVIKSYAEAILDGVYLDNLEETAKIISNESSKLESKIKQLLYFNSLNYVLENEKTTSEVRIDLLCQDLYERFKLIRSNIRWELTLEEISLRCSHDKMMVALENIVDNQLRYAETKITLDLKQAQKHLLLEIYNDGPNINEADVDKIFDKFYKDKKGHFGLGLAISQKIISFYHGAIQAVNHGKGVSFQIKIPINS
jgi:two-component system sensor histidine kinase CssS